MPGSTFLPVSPSVSTLAPQSMCVLQFLFQRPLLSSPAQQQIIEFIIVSQRDIHDLSASSTTTSSDIGYWGFASRDTPLSFDPSDSTQRVTDNWQRSSSHLHRPHLLATLHLTQHANDDLLFDPFHFVCAKGSCQIGGFVTTFTCRSLRTLGRSVEIRQ